MKKIEDTIESKNYAGVTDHEVELLAAAHLACSEAAKRTDGSYLRILVAVLQQRFDGVKNRKRVSAADLKAHSEYLAETHTRLYAFVLKGVTTPDVMDEETLDVDTRRGRAAVRNSRAAFARSSASTLQMYIRAGGDVRGLDVMSVSKGQLRTFAAQAAGANTPALLMSATLKRLEGQANTLAEDDPDEARTLVGDCIERLQKILDGLDAAKPDAGAITQVLRSRPMHTRQPAPAGRAHA